jgi:hypothetical protein
VGSAPDEFCSPEEVETRLKALGCYWGCDMDDYHQVWVTAWGHSFIVPMIGNGRLCPADVLLDIEAEIRNLRP